MASACAVGQHSKSSAFSYRWGPHQGSHTSYGQLGKPRLGQELRPLHFFLGDCLCCDPPIPWAGHFRDSEHPALRQVMDVVLHYSQPSAARWASGPRRQTDVRFLGPWTFKGGRRNAGRQGPGWSRVSRAWEQQDGEETERRDPWVFFHLPSETCPRPIFTALPL